MSLVYGNQTLDFQTISGAGLAPLKIDAEAAGTYRQFRLKNISGRLIENVKLRLVEIGEANVDASQLMQRANLTLAYRRQSSGGEEQQSLGVGPISVITEDPEELEGVLLNGWAQLSSDTFRWGNLLEVGPLDVDAYLELYARYQTPTDGDKDLFQFSIRNIARDTFLNTALTASGSDLLSLDGKNFTQNVQLGTMRPATVMLVWLQTDKMGQRIVNGLIQALSGIDVVATQLFWVDRGKPYIPPLMIFSISMGGNASADEEKQILADIEAFTAKFKKNIAAANWSGTETGRRDLL